MTRTYFDDLTGSRLTPDVRDAHVFSRDHGVNRLATLELNVSMVLDLLWRLKIAVHTSTLVRGSPNNVKMKVCWQRKLPIVIGLFVLHTASGSVHLLVGFPNLYDAFRMRQTRV